MHLEGRDHTLLHFCVFSMSKTILEVHDGHLQKNISVNKQMNLCLVWLKQFVSRNLGTNRHEIKEGDLDAFHNNVQRHPQAAKSLLSRYTKQTVRCLVSMPPSAGTEPPVFARHIDSQYQDTLPSLPCSEVLADMREAMCATSRGS